MLYSTHCTLHPKRKAEDSPLSGSGFLGQDSRDNSAGWQLVMQHPSLSVFVYTKLVQPVARPTIVAQDSFESGPT